MGVDDSSSSHDHICKKHVLVLGEDPTYGINERLGSPEKKNSINFSKANTKFCLRLRYNDDKSHFFFKWKRNI